MLQPLLDTLHESYHAHVARLRDGYWRALSESGYAAVVLHSGTVRLRSQYDDCTWPLRVVPHFAHWVPLEWPDSALFVTRGGMPRLFAYRDRSFWERQPEPPWEHFADAFDTAEVESVEVIGREVRALRQLGRVALIAEDLARAAAWGFEPEDVNPASLIRDLDALRVAKTAYEVACLAEANSRSAVGHQAVADAFLSGDASELDLHLLYLAETRQDDAQTPYKNIVAIGDNAAILHHIHYGRAAPTGDRSLLLDAGATCLGYASDVTRTYVRGDGEAASLFRELVTRLERLQRSACHRIEHGLPYELLHDAAHRELATVLRELDLVRLSDAELIDRGVTRLFLPHGLGHSLGLQSHDVGCLVAPPRPENPWLRNTTPIATDQVFTIEPGVYFIDSLLEKLAASPEGRAVNWPLVDALRPYGGVRIEDDLLVLPQGSGGAVTRNLSREALGD